MKMNTKKIYGMLWCVGMVGIVIMRAETFVLPKKKTTVSAALKEECCQEMGDVFKCMPRTTKLGAELQEEILKNLTHLMEGNKKNILQSADAEKVKKLTQKLQHLQKIMEDTQVLLSDCLELIKETPPGTV